jgi:hypothetical protein
VAVGGKGAGIFGADGSDFELEHGAGDGNGAGFDGHNALIEAIEESVEQAVFLAIEMENKMKLRFAGL